MNNTDEYYTVNDRQYLNPNVPLQESEGFIQKLRDTQAADTQRINTETHNLGTNVPSNLGGLGGSESIWKGRYQDPQTNAMISDLKNAAQAQALSTTLTNLMNQKKKEYSDLYKKKAKDYENAQKKSTATTGETPAPKVKTVPNDNVGSATGFGSVIGGSGNTVIPNLDGRPMVIGPDGTTSVVEEGTTYDARNWIEDSVNKEDVVNDGKVIGTIYTLKDGSTRFVSYI